MIEESTNLIIDGNGEKKVKIKGKGFSIDLKFCEEKMLKDIWVYEQGNNEWSPLSSANYNSEGSLISKHVFSYDENNNMLEYTSFDKENTLHIRTIYENDNKGRLKFARCYDGKGTLEYTFEKQWDGDGHTCIKTTYRDASGEEIGDRPLKK